jgi:LytS/YehU family sensor histidine kinase
LALAGLRDWTILLVFLGLHVGLSLCVRVILCVVLTFSLLICLSELEGVDLVRIEVILALLEPHQICVELGGLVCGPVDRVWIVGVVPTWNDVGIGKLHWLMTVRDY